MIKHSFKPKEIFPSSPSSSTITTPDRPSKSNPSQEQEQNQTLPENPLHNSSSSSLAAAVIANNEDLLTQIFLYLPPNPLLRFQSVCRGWRSIISNPTLRCLHSRLYPSSTTASCTPASLFLHRSKHFTPPVNFITFREEEVNSMANNVSHFNTSFDGEISGLHSCNGLLAIVLDHDDECKEFVVYNPTTREYKLIPMVKADFEHVVVNIVFDPVKSDHYKLVCVWQEPSQNYSLRFSVYSSEIGAWEDTKAMGTGPLIYKRGVLWNGDLHWISYWSSSMCFDVDNECLGPLMYVIRTPEESRDEWYFGESGGHLFYIDLYEPQSVLFDVFEFELEREHQHWKVKYRVELTPLTTPYPQMIIEDYEPSDEERFAFYIAYFLMDEKEKKARLVLSLAGKVIPHDINNRILVELAEVEQVLIMGIDISKCRWVLAYQHIETLACL